MAHSETDDDRFCLCVFQIVLNSFVSVCLNGVCLKSQNALNATLAYSLHT